VSPEWGYLNTAITNLGTGLKASLMLHLPALSMSGLIKRAVKASAQLGLSIRGFFSENMESLGDMYIIANEITIGLAEKEIIGNLGRIAVQLAGYENRTREELMEKRRVDIEDRVFRAWGLLTFCRYVTHREAIEGLSALRLGVSLGLIASVDAPTITALLFLSQKSHIQRVLQSQADAVDSKLIDYTRAKIIREALTQARGG
jgi:protein arginine kinase